MAKTSSSNAGAFDAAVQSGRPGAFASMRGLRRSVVATLVACAAVAFLAAPSADAQTPAPPAAPKTKPAPKPKTPPAQAQAPQQPQQPPQAPPPGQAQAPQQPQMPQFVSTPWVKLCETQPKKLCVTRTLLRVDNGAPAAMAEFAEPEGAPKLLRITLPLGMLLEYGTRMAIDQGQFVNAKFVVCLEGCITVFPISDELQAQLKKGQTLTVQAVNLNNATMSFPLPLKNFGQALDGPPTDPKVYLEQQKKLQEELQRQHPPQAAAPTAPQPQH